MFTKEFESRLQKDKFNFQSENNNKSFLAQVKGQVTEDQQNEENQEFEENAGSETCENR